MFPVDKYWNLLIVNLNFCLKNTFVYEDLIQIWIYTIMLFSSFVFYITLIFHFSLFLLARNLGGVLAINNLPHDMWWLTLLKSFVHYVLTVEITCHNPLFPRDLRACMNSSWVNCDCQVIKCSEKDSWKDEVMV